MVYDLHPLLLVFFIGNGNCIHIQFKIASCNSTVGIQGQGARQGFDIALQV